MTTIMSHAEFINYARNILGLKLIITRTRVMFDKSVKDLASLIVPAYYDEIARAKLGKLDIDVIEDYVHMNKPVEESIRSCAKKDLPKIYGIIMIRSQTSLGLREAKDLYEANQENWKGDNEETRARIDKLDIDDVEPIIIEKRTIVESIRNCAIKGLKIQALIRIRAQTGLGLKEAKDLFEANEETWKLK